MFLAGGFRTGNEIGKSRRKPNGRSSLTSWVFLTSLRPRAPTVESSVGMLPCCLGAVDFCFGDLLPLTPPYGSPCLSSLCVVGPPSRVNLGWHSTWPWTAGTARRSFFSGGYRSRGDALRGQLWSGSVFGTGCPSSLRRHDLVSPFPKPALDHQRRHEKGGNGSWRKSRSDWPSRPNPRVPAN